MKKPINKAKNKTSLQLHVLIRTLYTLIFFSIVGIINAQQITDSVHPLFRGKLDGDKIRESFDNFEKAILAKKTEKGKLYNDVLLSLFHSKSLYTNTVFNKKNEIKELDDFKEQQQQYQSYSQIVGAYRNITAVPLFDSLPVIVTAYGIDSANKTLYRYRVLLNKTIEIVPWTQVKYFCPVFMYYRYNVDGTEQKQMAYLGQFKVPVGNSITIEVKNIKQPDTTYYISVVWIKRAPTVIANFTAQTLKELIQVYKYQWKHDEFEPNGPTYYGDIKLPSIDSLLIKTASFDYHHNSIFFYLQDKVKKADLVEYNLLKDNDSSRWIANTFDPNIISLQNLTAGSYKLLTRYAFQRQTVSSFSFSVKPAWFQTLWFRIIAGALSALAVLSVYLSIKNRRQKAKIKEQQIEQQIVQAEIKSIKSQFNPHFVFNALSSIQGLITKNDIEAAHIYLNDFSRLLRNSLKESEKEFISLSKDLEIIDNYLKLEQLRFGFLYEIVVDPEINKDAIEVPVLLLQPVIENAVKHGVSGLYQDGILSIKYTVAKADLIATVENNGSMYKDENKNGLGLKLTSDRIALVNKTLKDQQITREIKNTGNGTKVIFVFKNWLL